jgi:hypothetical protein
LRRLSRKPLKVSQSAGDESSSGVAEIKVWHGDAQFDRDAGQ